MHKNQGWEKDKMIVDVLHVEDHPLYLSIIKNEIERLGLSHSAVSSLRGLAEYLQKNSARAYIIDGRFPRTETEEPEFLFPEAIRMIRRKDNSARIIFMSDMDRIEVVAKEHNVPYISKGELDAQILADLLTK